MFSWNVLKHRLCAALIAGLIASPAALATPTVALLATPPTPQPGHTLSLDVLIGGITDLYAYQFSLGFNPAMLQETGASEGAFLRTAGGTVADPGSIDNGAGTIAFAFGSLLGAVPGASGSGVLMRYNFNVIGAGSSTVALSELVFLDSTLTDVGVVATNLSLQAVPEPDAYVLLALGIAAIVVQRRLFYGRVRCRARHFGG